MQNWGITLTGTPLIITVVPGCWAALWMVKRYSSSVSLELGSGCVTSPVTFWMPCAVGLLKRQNFAKWLNLRQRWHSVPWAGHERIPPLCGKRPPQFLHTLFDCLGRGGGFLLCRLLRKPSGFRRFLCNPLPETRELSCGKRDCFGWVSATFNGNVGVWELSPSSLFACSSVRSSDPPWLRTSCSVKLSRRARLRRRLSLVLWMICVRISSSTLGKWQSDAFVLIDDKSRWGFRWPPVWVLGTRRLLCLYFVWGRSAGWKERQPICRLYRYPVIYRKYRWLHRLRM